MVSASIVVASITPWKIALVRRKKKPDGPPAPTANVGTAPPAADANGNSAVVPKSEMRALLQRWWLMR